MDNSLKNPLKSMNNLENIIDTDVISDENVKSTERINAEGVGIDINLLVSHENESLFEKWKKNFLSIYNTIFLKNKKTNDVSDQSEKNVEEQKKYLRDLYLEIRSMNKFERLEKIKEKVKDENQANTLISLFEKMDKKLEGVSSSLSASSQTLIDSLDNSLSEMDETSKGIIKQVMMMTPGGRLFSLLEDEFGLGSRLWNGIKTFNEKTQEYFKKTEEELIEIELEKETQEKTFINKLYKLFEKYFSTKEEKEEDDKIVNNFNEIQKNENKFIKRLFSPIQKFFKYQQDEQTKLIIEKEKQRIQEEETQDKLEEIKDAITELEIEPTPQKEKEDEGFFDKLFSGLIAIFTGGKIGRFFTNLFGFKFIKSLSGLLGGKKIAEGAGSLFGKVGKFGRALGIAGLGFSVLAGGYTGSQRAGEWFNKKEEDLNWKEKLSSIIGGIIEGLTFGLFDGEFVAKLTDGILDIASSLVEGVWNIVKTIFDTGWNYITNGVTGYFNTLKKYIWDPIANTFKGIADFFSDIFSPIKDFFDTVLEGLDKFLKAINPLYGVFDKLTGFFGSKEESKKISEKRAQELQEKGYWVDDWGENTADIEKIKKDYKSGKLSKEDVQSIIEHGNLEAKYEQDLNNLLAEQEKVDVFNDRQIKERPLNADIDGDFYINTVMKNLKKKRERENFQRKKTVTEEQTLASIKKADNERMLKAQKQREMQMKQGEKPVVVQSPPVILPPEKKKRVDDSDLLILTSTIL